MGLIVKYGDRLLDFARDVQSTPDQWLARLRWVAIGGMLATIAGARLIAPSLRLGPLLALVGLVVVVNLLWLVRLSRRPARGSTVEIQIALDVVLLAAILWFSGGLGNPYMPFLTCQIVLAGLLASSATTLRITALTLAMAVTLHAAAPLPLDGSRFDAVQVVDVARLMATLSLGTFLGFFVMLYARRMEQLRESAAQNERLAAVGRTVAAMCHELNTPLGTIVLAGKDLEHIGGGQGHAEIIELARTVTTSASRASEIISLLRGTVRPTARREAVDVAAFVSGHVTRELDRLGYAGERIVTAPTAVEVALLPTALGQILTNLLANAVDALGDAACPRIEVVVAPTGEGVDVSITDNGRGVPYDFLSRLGEPFQTTKVDGTGLGLYISSLLAERMGGRLQLENLPGDGARLTLSLRGARDEASS